MGRKYYLAPIFFRPRPEGMDQDLSPLPGYAGPSNSVCHYVGAAEYPAWDVPRKKVLVSVPASQNYAPRGWQPISAREAKIFYKMVMGRDPLPSEVSDVS